MPEESDTAIEQRYFVIAFIVSAVLWLTFGGAAWFALENQAIWIRAPVSVAVALVFAKVWLWMLSEALSNLPKKTTEGGDLE